MLTTFTNTGLLPEETRPAANSLWAGGSIGELTMNAYARLAQ